jgi:hypothetical protein
LVVYRHLILNDIDLGAIGEVKPPFTQSYESHELNTGAPFNVSLIFPKASEYTSFRNQMKEVVFNNLVTIAFRLLILPAKVSYQFPTSVKPYEIKLLA